jgi:F420-dependent oxidoreductase-like protein
MTSHHHDYHTGSAASLRLPDSSGRRAPVYPRMALTHSVFLPVGFGGELARFPDPVTAHEAVTRTARAADESGFGTLWTPDHFVTIPPSDATVLESWTLLAGLARDTTRVRLGHLVTADGYRNPALQAKLAATLDVLSHGRYTFGIGAGWYEPDYTAFGYDYPDGPERLRRLRESLEIIRSLWTAPVTTYDGRHHRVRDAVRQHGVQQPHVPVMIAGGGEKVTLRLVAEHGDLCNIIESPERLAHKYAVLRDHCADVGRDHDSIRRTAVTACLVTASDDDVLDMPAEHPLFPGDYRSYCLLGTPDTIHARLAAYEAAGVQELVIGFVDPFDTAAIRAYAREFIR